MLMEIGEEIGIGAAVGVCISDGPLVVVK